jgi:hypothetical protein
MKPRYNFMPKKPMLFFTCEWGVYPKANNTSVCYTTDKKRARLVSIALNRFLNSDEGKKWLDKNFK